MVQCLVVGPYENLSDDFHQRRREFAEASLTLRVDGHQACSMGWEAGDREFGVVMG